MKWLEEYPKSVLDNFDNILNEILPVYYECTEKQSCYSIFKLYDAGSKIILEKYTPGQHLYADVYNKDNFYYMHKILEKYSKVQTLLNTEYYRECSEQKWNHYEKVALLGSIK